MSIGAEVLSLRKSQGSTVDTLLAALDWQNAAEGIHKLTRGHAVTEAVDKVLLKVAVHAAEAQRSFEDPRPAVTPRRRVVRGTNRINRWMRDPGATRQLSFATFRN